MDRVKLASRLKELTYSAGFYSKSRAFCILAGLENDTSKALEYLREATHYADYITNDATKGEDGCRRARSVDDLQTAIELYRKIDRAYTKMGLEPPWIKAAEEIAIKG